MVGGGGRRGGGFYVYVVLWGVMRIASCRIGTVGKAAK